MTQYDPERIRRQQEREAERLRKAAIARQREYEREQKQAHIEARKREVASMNADIAYRLDELASILRKGIRRAPVADFTSVVRTASRLPLDLTGVGAPNVEPSWEDYEPAEPGFWTRTFGSKAAIDARLEAAREEYGTAHDQWRATETARRAEVQRRTRKNDQQLAEARAQAASHNSALAMLAKGVRRRDRTDVEEYLIRSLGLMVLPADFPRLVELAYDPKHEHVVLQAEIPPPSSVPTVKNAKYVQARDEIVETVRIHREQAELYRGVVAQVCLLSAWTLLRSDPSLGQVSFNGRVRHINPATGHEEQPHIISVVVERAAFESLNLDRVQPEECLRHLHALVSPHPFELEAVQPLVDFDKSRLAFIEGLDAVSSLDSRPDLMAMSPTEFEHLVRQLLEADPTVISVESLTTRQSNDGGVDGVVYIHQALGRSMTVVQAKQYGRTKAIGPAHVRELIGAMHETRAGNGILVTTSRFTGGAISSATEFGRIQLIDGQNLVYMIKELLGKDVLIGDQRVR